MGLRDRGLCWHWARDMEARLAEEKFETLDLHRALANADSLRLEHSTLIISHAGDTYAQGIVLDPWRFGGALFWSQTTNDARYIWRLESDVFKARRVAERFSKLSAQVSEKENIPL